MLWNKISIVPDEDLAYDLRNEQNGCARLIPVPYWHVYEWHVHPTLSVYSI